MADDAAHIGAHVNVPVPGCPARPYHCHKHTENLYWILKGENLLVVE